MLRMLQEEIESFRSAVRAIRVTPTLSRQSLKAQLEGSYDFQDPVDDGVLFRDVTRLMRDGTVHVTHPRYFGLFNPGTTLESIVGDALTALYNPQLAAWSHAPAANEIERHVLGFLGGYLGLDREGAHANFTTGGAEANHSAVIVALSSRIDDFVKRGIAGVEPRIYVSAESHHSFHKTAVMCGLGAEAIRTIPVDERFRMDPDALRAAIREDRRLGFLPVLVVGTAGTTSSGTIDMLSEIGAIAAQEEIWFHCDAAWGGSYLLVPELRGDFEGIELADSVTWDAHKGLSVPMGAGMFFCRHPEQVGRAFAVNTAYMPAREGDAIDPYASTVQWTRRAIGLKVFLSIASRGATGYEKILRRQVAMGNRIREGVVSRGWRVENDTSLPVVCFSHRRLKESSAYAGLAGEIQDAGRVWISHTVLGGTVPVLRACVTSYETDEADIDVLLDEIDSLLN